jgi:hypothetical protein
MTKKTLLFVAAISGCCFLPSFSRAGSWVEVSPPVVASSGITGIAVVNDSDVWAIGSFGATNQMTLTEHWDGTSWSIVPSPNPDPTSSILTGVAALATNDVWAVGYGVHGDWKTIILHWDGTTWSVVPSPNLTNFDNFLEAVSAISPTDIWAVGYTDTPSGAHHFQPLALHWDGATWSTVQAPFSGGTSIFAVHAIASNDVWAVGFDHEGQNFSASTTYTMHWDGTTWSTVPSPNGSFALNQLAGVAGASSSDVWAVGGTGPDFSSENPLVLHWDGSTWSIVTTPSLTGSSGFRAVLANSTNNVWAVGTTDGQALAERWNGRRWAVATLPVLQNPSDLFAISAGRMHSLWTTGAQATGQLFLKMAP